MGQWNDYGNNERYSQPLTGPSWSGDPPPPTEPALPPIRSASSADAPREAGNATTPASRSLIAAQDGVRRDVMSSSTRSRPLPATTSSTSAGDGLPAPLIIPGDGKTDGARPVFRRQRPRSRAMQLALISIAGVMLLVILYAATPISAGASNKLNGFIAGSNIWNPPPTPTTTPTPTPVPVYTGGGGGGGGAAPNPGAAAIMSDIRSVFGPYAQGALNVSRCESGYDPNAWNGISILGSHAEGIFQILYPITWRGTSQASQSPYNSHANILAAYEIFSRDGYSWREWSCQP